MRPQASEKAIRPSQIQGVNIVNLCCLLYAFVKYWSFKKFLAVNTTCVENISTQQASVFQNIGFMFWLGPIFKLDSREGYRRVARPECQGRTKLFPGEAENYFFYSSNSHTTFSTRNSTKNNLLLPRFSTTRARKSVNKYKVQNFGIPETLRQQSHNGYKNACKKILLDSYIQNQIF